MFKTLFNFSDPLIRVQGERNLNFVEHSGWQRPAVTAGLLFSLHVSKSQYPGITNGFRSSIIIQKARKQMNDLIKLIMASSTFIIFYSMVSKYLQDTCNIPDPITTTFYGILIGKQGLRLTEPHYVYSKNLISVASRIVLCIQTMAVALSLPRKYVFKNSKSIFSLVIFIGFLKCMLTFVILKSLSFLDNSTCWAIAASLTPTDPILSSSIVKGRFAKTHVSEKLRLLLSAESGMNDGFGILMLGISFDILKNPDFRGGVYSFVVYTIGNKVLLSASIGYVIGLAVQSITKMCCSMEMIRAEVMSIHTLSLSFLGLAIMDATNGSELICIFFIGIALNEDEWYTLESSSNRLSEVMESAFCKILFIFIGSTIDFSRFNLRMVYICILIILIRRPLILLFSYKAVPLIENKKEALFVGWFGPVGVGALYYCLMYDRKVDTLTIDYGICMVLISTVIHGLSVPFYTCFVKTFKKTEALEEFYEI